jgi:hypothetical protein
MDKQSLRSQKEREEKEPGFARLESYQKSLIRNASASPPYDSPAESPTEFYKLFLSKKSQFKAKEALVHRILLDKVSFNPGAAFVTCLWHAEFVWILPGSPSGVSIFFCPKAKSLSIAELEKEWSFALVDKLKAGDNEKLSKQKLHLPSTVMDMVFMVQNFHAIISLCFGKSAHSVTFLRGWCDHMIENRLIYSSIQAADQQFFAKVLFAIDSALQIHCRSCGIATDRNSVNDKVLMMQDTQDLILQHNFIQQLPKTIADKFSNSDDLQDKFKWEKWNGGKFNPLQDKNGGKELLSNNDKSYLCWKIKDGENYTNMYEILPTRFQ